MGEFWLLIIPCLVSCWKTILLFQPGLDRILRKVEPFMILIWTFFQYGQFLTKYWTLVNFECIHVFSWVFSLINSAWRVHFKHPNTRIYPFFFKSTLKGVKNILRVIIKPTRFYMSFIMSLKHNIDYFGRTGTLKSGKDDFFSKVNFNSILYSRFTNMSQTNHFKMYGKWAAIIKRQTKMKFRKKRSPLEGLQ